MADLTGQTPAATYKGLLQVNDYTNGVDATAKYIQDGEGTDSVLSISTTNVGIGTASPNAKTVIKSGINSLPVSDISTDTGTALRINGADEAALDFGATGRINAGGTGQWIQSRHSGVDSTYYNLLLNPLGGNVGIGTTDADTKLELSGTGSQSIKITSTDTGDVNNPAMGLMTIADTGELVLYRGSEGGTGVERAIRLVAGTNNSGYITFDTGGGVSPIERMRIDPKGNVGIGTDSFGTSAAGVLAIKNGTAPTSSPADMVQLYAKDDAGSSRLYVRNEAGTETVLSPHAADAPSSLYDRPPGVEEMHRSANYYLGTIVFTNVDRRNSLMQKQLNGEELPEDRTFTVTETFAEYNARTGADLQVEDWAANQQAMFDVQEEKVLARQAEIEAWDNEEEEAPEPLQSYVKKPKPEWLS